MMIDDHWDFLEEIEAPMWVDLSIEPTSTNNQNRIDDWFDRSHLFHHQSSHEIKSAVDFDLAGAASPNLPGSVSKSRGKDYNNKKWGRNQGKDFSLAEHHPVQVLSGKSTTKSNPQSSFTNSKGTSSSKSSLVTSNSTSLKSKPSLTSRNLAKKRIESGSSSSTITTNKSPRKSCVTREVASGGGKSSSSKSSVGSSLNPGCYDVRKNSTSTSKCQHRSTWEKSNAARMTQSAKDKVKTTAKIRVEENKRPDQERFCAKPKNVGAKALGPSRVDQQKACTTAAALKGKERAVQGGGANGISGVGRGISDSWKGTMERIVKSKEKVNSQRQTEIQGNEIQRRVVFFR